MVTGLIDTLTTRIKRTPAEIRKTVEGNLGLVALASSGQARGPITTTALTHSYQKRFLARVSGRGLRLDFDNFFNNAAAGTGPIEANTGNPITIKAGVLLSVASGLPIPVTWGGATLVTIPSGGRVPLTDVVDIDLVQGTLYYVVTTVTVGTIGDKIPGRSYANAGRNEGAHAGDDSAVAGGIGSGNYANGYVYGPSHIWGVPYSDQRTARVAAVGDSIMRGASQTGDDDGLNVIAPMSQTSVVNVAAYGEFAGQAAAPNGMTKRIALIDGCTAWHCNYGVNDLAGSHVYATLQGYLISIWRKVSQRLGTPGYQWTLTPRTTSTDGWSTTGNQTVFNTNSYNTDRVALNAWLRDGAPIHATTFAPVPTGTSPANTIRAGATGHPLAGHFEVADVVESARDSGLFKGGHTFDGTHLSTAAYTAIAAAIDWTKLGIS